MPLYEYYCEHCNGIFEAIRQMRDSSDPSPCPECSREAPRMMSTFAAFTVRDGYPRRIPDKGTYWHMGKEVKKRVTGGVKPFQHPELNKPKPPRRKSKGEMTVEKEKASLREKERKKMLSSGVRPSGRHLPKSLRK